MDPIPVTPDNSLLPGVTVVGQSGLSMLTLNTTNTSITSVTCVAILLSNQLTFSKKINVTIYGKSLLDCDLVLVTNIVFPSIT